MIAQLSCRNSFCRSIAKALMSVILLVGGSFVLSSCTGRKGVPVQKPVQEQKGRQPQPQKSKENPVKVRKRCVIASVSAYTSSRRETDNHPRLTADGTRLNDSSRVVAVSRDLEQKGFVFGLPVFIEGLQGTYRVADRTNRRLKNRVDLYMGMDRARALKWGVRRKEVCLITRVAEGKSKVKS